MKNEPITVPAARVVQGDRGLYATSIKVKYLMMDGFYRIEHLNPETGEDGFQRILQPSRANELADYIIEGQDTKNSFLPTSIFLATEEDIDFNPENNSITFDASEIGGFSVVDGQHRLEGLRIAVDKISEEKKKSLLDFEIPVNIAYKLPYIDQMSHFLTVNKMQKSVDQGVEQQIISHLTKIKGTNHIPTMPKRIQKDIGMGITARALALVTYLNETDGSPWKNKVRMGEQKKKDFPDTTIAQATFVKVIKRHIMTAGHPLWLTAKEDSEEQQRLFLNYWIAISELLEPEDKAETVLYKSLGVELFAIFCKSLFTTLNASVKTYTVDVIKQNLKYCFDNIEGDYEKIGDPKWWLSGEKGQAGKFNPSECLKISAAMYKALLKL